MSLTSDSMTPAGIAAVTGNNGTWGNEGGAYWLLILFLFCFMGWGGNAFNGGANPYTTSTVTQADMQRGFDQQAVINHLDTLGQTVSNGFANAEVSRANQQSTVLQQFAQQAYNQQAQSNATQQGIADLKYTIATENCADRNALNQGLNQLESSIGAKTQAILDKMCQQEIEAYRRENEQLRTQLNMATLAASQNAQTGQIIGQNNIQTQEIINRLATPTPVPAYIVANPFTGVTGGTADATKVTA